MAVARRAIKGTYDGECIILDEHLNIPPGTGVEVLIPEDAPTWAESVLGLPRLVLTGEGPTVAEMIVEDRR